MGQPKNEAGLEQLAVRVHGTGEGRAPTLIYLPGLHGDWTLVGRFRRALGSRVRFVEVTYPRTLTWSLADYAAAVERELAVNGIGEGWILGESFGSQVLWSVVLRKQLRIQGLILAGGFVRHPARWLVRLGERLCGGISLTVLTRILFGYARLARARFGASPEALAELNEFIARRTELDRQAAKHRLGLIAGNDPRPVARETDLPLFALTGAFDPIVPWPWVQRALRHDAPSLREYRIIWHADHNVLGTGVQAAADQVVRWMKA